jgi:DeoR/GlpR family transcriptional regulator of sugar metabolism
MAEKITFDDATGTLTHSITTIQKDVNGLDVTNECRVDHNGAGILAVRRDPAIEAKLTKAVRDKITARETALNEAALAEAAARLAAEPQ